MEAHALPCPDLSIKRGQGVGAKPSDAGEAKRPQASEHPGWQVSAKLSTQLTGTSLLVPVRSKRECAEERAPAMEACPAKLCRGKMVVAEGQGISESPNLAAG